MRRSTNLARGGGTELVAERQQWKSQAGFIFAAASSAVGLGNIVFFSANAYRYGAGAFYIPYIIALFAIGIPVMMLEFGLGQRFQRSFPVAMRQVAGKPGEIVGWFALFNALVITMYYVTILAWVSGMWWRSLSGTLFAPSVAVPAFGLDEGVMPNPHASFFSLLSSWGVVGAVVVVWAINFFGLYRGTKSIEAMVRWTFPFVWLAMIAFIILGLSLDGGVHGAYWLFEPNFEIMRDPLVWNGAASQIFFSLTLGFGVMTAYSSYLPRETDHTAGALIVGTMNCSLELFAGLAIFSLLFAFSLMPQASTLGMTFFIMPKAIGLLPWATQLVGAAFFTLLFAAGITSSMSLIEATLAGIADRFKIPRSKALFLLVGLGFLGSVSFALPIVIDAELSSNGTLGLSFLDLMDHYAFSYGLIIVGFLECVIVGWFFPVTKLREQLNETSAIRLGRWFDILIRYVVPFVLGSIIVTTAMSDLGLINNDGAREGLRIYGDTMTLDFGRLLPWLSVGIWLVATLGVALVLANLPAKKSEHA